MSIVYLLKNQHGHYLDKSGEWVSPDNSRTLYRTNHKDEALNRKVEFSVKNFELRISIFEAKLNAKGDVELPEEELCEAQSPSQADAFSLEAANSEDETVDVQSSEPEDDSACEDAQHEDAGEDESSQENDAPYSHLRAVP